MIKYLLLSPISTINCHGSFEVFTNPPNPTTHLIIHWKKLTKKFRPLNLAISLANSIIFHIWLHVHLQLKFIVTNQVEKVSRDIQWALNYLPSCKNNYIFIYFGMPLKMDDINVFFIFIFIQINIGCNINCICNYKPLCSCLCDCKLFLPSVSKDSHI
jgi:hypothetical protein